MTRPTVTPLLVAELLVAEGERWPVHVHVIDHPEARVLVDTGFTELRPEVADMEPRLFPLGEQPFDLAGVDVAVRHAELDDPQTEGQRRVRALEPELVWLAHEHEPWRPPAGSQAAEPSNAP